MVIGGFVKKIQNIMRGDSGINGDAQRIEQMVWILFLKVYDVKEEDWEFHDETFHSIIPEPLRWRNWAVDTKDGAALTGQGLLDFVNVTLFPKLKNLQLDSRTPLRQSIVRAVFEDSNQYMKDGVLLRQIINEIDAIQFDDYKERHAFGEIYETILRSLQGAGNAGEFYTPRAVTDFMAQMLAPQLGERIADFAAGTGGFLTSSLNYLEPQVSSVGDRELYAKSVFGIEKKQFPYLLAVTNLLIHDVDSPQLFHGNSLERNVRQFKDQDRFEVVLMNPPYGGTEQENLKMNFPAELRSGETADLFVVLAMYRLKRDGRAALILPDGFLFGADGPKRAIKRKLVEEFNLHTIVRMPMSVFAPYTSIATNILFFDNTGPTERTWFYRVDKPDGYKHFSKTKPMLLEHFEGCMSWWDDRVELTNPKTGSFTAQSFTAAELAERSYNLDLCGYPRDEEEVLSPEETIDQYKRRRDELNVRIDERLMLIEQMLGAGK
ncbi:SAM-dependent DNA methyltransferase [Arthrobacter crusticola]|uniref:site-specific DNA-methyltransferase (adenine-specific) n=1 Tax=Arthrobacter crusticola TaxID=2547960 RepID=A0A4R5TLR9_9MICC|nr:class I SAM-dependent DNA methyltransferase [Arthrobacter crusticola]TDK23507.1 SAM-dependent DNA methyltransferase [Arthrobacter crusticola]